MDFSATKKLAENGSDAASTVRKFYNNTSSNELAAQPANVLGAQSAMRSNNSIPLNTSTSQPANVFGAQSAMSNNNVPLNASTSQPANVLGAQSAMRSNNSIPLNASTSQPANMLGANLVSNNGLQTIPDPRTMNVIELLAMTKARNLTSKAVGFKEKSEYVKLLTDDIQQQQQQQQQRRLQQQQDQLKLKLERQARNRQNRQQNRQRNRQRKGGAPTSGNQLNANNAAQPITPGGGAAPNANVVDEIGEADDVEAFHESDFSAYTPKYVNFGVPHPDELIESASLGSADLPPITYKLKLKEKPCVTNGALSNAQLESITYACQISEKRMKPDTNGQANRLGFFLGDGAGVGKGRQLAGFVLENWLKGAKRHLWLSASADLCLDSRRDLDDIGAQEIRSIELRKLPYGKIDKETGLLFCTYSSLISKSSKTKQSRLDQIVAWLGGNDFNGCVMFDECHKAKNIFEDDKKSTKTGLAVIDLQKLLPNARIIYCSATGVSEPGNMAYMTRLDLWGAGKPFLQFKDFKLAIESSGIGMMELLALHLKRNGQYISRTLSFARCTFKVEEKAVNHSQLVQYDAASLIWQDLFKDLMVIYPNCKEGSPYLLLPTLLCLRTHY